ncbi:hypothetical protein G9A89_002968 [Geosiphon pyriformis]|nr:hypothetical protein G9A89_002968 [Geosiphon pyriformis]
MPLQFFTQLSNNLGKLLEYADDFNVIVKVGNQPEFAVFQAHSIILRARSEYFRAALSSNWAKKEGESFVFEKPNISPTVFDVILKYIYSGTIYLDQQEGDDILELLVAADELILEELIDPLQEHLMRNMEKWLKENLLRILDTVIQRDACVKLREHCLNTLCPDPYRFFESEDFKALEESTLITLVSRDDLNMDEGHLWDYLIRWGVANTPNLKNDVSKWSIRDFWALKMTLQKCVPLVRFWQLSGGDFHEKVKPFEKILTNNLKLRLLRHFSKSPLPMPEPPSQAFLIPERVIDSIIITHQQAALISSWIDKKFITANTPFVDLLPSKYYFKLLFRGSRDGFSARMFHSRCDNRGATIVVVRVEDSKEIIGGYNPIGWSSPREVEWKGTKDSFIFSLGDSKELDLEKSRLSRIKPDCMKDAIQLHEGLGPSFGFYEFKILDEAHECKSSYGTGGLRYQNKIREKCNYFGVDDYEVFQVVKK